MSKRNSILPDLIATEAKSPRPSSLSAAYMMIPSLTSRGLILNAKFSLKINQINQREVDSHFFLRVENVTNLGDGQVALVVKVGSLDFHGFLAAVPGFSIRTKALEVRCCVLASSVTAGSCKYSN